jgi:hypothetical protein
MIIVVGSAHSELAEQVLEIGAHDFKVFFCGRKSALPTPTRLALMYHSIYGSNHYALMTEDGLFSPKGRIVAC